MQIAKGFEVEWCSNVPFNKETQDHEMEQATYEVRDFTTMEKAVAYARKVLPKDYFGSVRVTEFEMVPFNDGFPGATREYIGESEYVD